MEEEYEDRKDIRVIVKNPYEKAYVTTIKDDYKTITGIVHGVIDVTEFPGMENVDIFVNDEGKIIQMPGNFWLPNYVDHEYDDCVCGPCYIAGYDPDTGDSISLTDEQIDKCMKFIDYFSLKDDMDIYTDYYYIKTYMTIAFEKYQREGEPSEM
jgi:hypothetical protein